MARAQRGRSVMAPPQINIGANDRVAFFGKTGSGKTTLAKHMLSLSNKPWVIFDAKHSIRMPGVPIHHDFRGKERFQIVRDDGYGDMDFWDEMFWQVLRDGSPRVVYVDEAVLITPPRAILPNYGRAIKVGRELGIPIWTGSQRPKEIPSPIFTEAEHFFTFRLTYDDDREKVASFTTTEIRPYLAAIKTKTRKHDAVYYDVDGDRIIDLYMTKEAAPDGKRRRKRAA